MVVENFPVGTLGRYGLDYAVLSSLNPKLVYVSCTGFGQTGPYAQKKGYDTVFQAMGGLMSLTGERGGGPVKPGLPVADLTSGLWVADRDPRGARRARLAPARAAMSISRCSTGRWRCSRSPRRAISRSARCRRGWAPSIRAACPRRPSAARTASTRTSPRATSTGRRCAKPSASRTGARPFRTMAFGWRSARRSCAFSPKP